MKIFAILVVFLTNISILICQNEIHVAGVPEMVTVFQIGANLKINLKVNLKKGTNLVYIDSLPSNIDPNSIRLSTGSSATVMSTDFRQESIKPEDQPEPNNILVIRDSIDNINYQLMDLNNKTDVLKGEENLITAFKLHPETEKGASVQDLTNLSNYYNKRVNEIKKEILTISVKQKELNKILTSLNKVIIEFEKTKITTQNFQIVATISSESAGIKDMELNCYTPSAGWIPNYEIKVKDVTSPVSLTYKALVSQYTGKDWNEVKLILSTRNPNMSNTMPYLTPWYLRIIESSARGDLDSPLMPTGTANSVRSSKYIETSMVVDGMEIGTVDNKYMTVEFAPANRYSIKSDNRKQDILLNEVDVPAVYEYYCVPKLDPDAFLIAKVADWGKLNLLPGEAYIYFENTYLGKTTINPQTTNDSLSLSLGRDKSIVIKREVVANMTETKFLSSNVIKQYGYLITVKNNRKSDINITIEDQFPVTTHEKIEVELLESSGAKIDNEKGFLKWYVNIPAGKSIERKFGYKIETPNN